MLVLLLSLLAGCTAPGPTPSAADSVTVTYIGNEGFLIETGGKKVLIDALYRTGVSGYVVHAHDVRKSLERALPPFDNVDLVLATHYHADHFDPDAVGVHLLSNRRALFVTTNQAAGQMANYQGYRNIQARVVGGLPEEGEETTIEHEGIVVRLLNLHHGRGRPVENLGFLVEISGRKFLHVGDTEVTSEEIGVFGLDEREIDFFFVPYWFLIGDASQGLVQAVNPKTVIPMHIPPQDDPRNYMQDTGGFDGTVARIESNHPGAVTLRDVMTSRTFP